MLVQVDLLPREAAEREAAARRRTLLIVAFVLFVAALAVATVQQQGRITEAEARLAVEQEALAALQTDQAALSEFAALEADVTQAHAQLIAGLGDEVSFAAVLQDVASVTPPDVQLTSLKVSLDLDAVVDPAVAGPVGTLVAVGLSATDHAPGLERLLLELDKVAALHELFFTSSLLEEPSLPYPTFTVESRVGTESRTGRYADGLPEELR